MRRDYFTCVFLALIAGALTFVCFKPLYFTYNVIVVREFSVFECIASILYASFFVLFLPCFSAFRKKEWVNWGLATYGLMIYLPVWFYPSAEALQAEDVSLVTTISALCLRAIYAVMQAPFAALSKVIGDSAASKVVYWIMPVAIVWPILFKIGRFYRRAYLSEQLNPMPVKKETHSSQAPEAPEKPEVLGTVISAPVTAQTPADVTRNVLNNSKSDGAVEMPSPAADEKPAMKEGRTSKRAAVRAPVRPVFEGMEAPEKEDRPELEAGPAKEPAKPKSDEAIPLGAPAPKSDEAIPMGAPKPRSDEAIPLGAPAPKSDGVINLGAPESDSGDK